MLSWREAGARGRGGAGVSDLAGGAAALVCVSEC